MHQGFGCIASTASTVQSRPAMQGGRRQCGPGALAVVGVWPWLQAALILLTTAAEYGSC